MAYLIMLKKRIIAVLPLYHGIVVQSIGFNRYLPIGKPDIAIEFLNSWGIDEIVVLDIMATKNDLVINPDYVKNFSRKCFVPLAVGGGIRKLSEVDGLIQSGADKVVVNQSILKTPELITKIAKNYGDQCVVASVDIIREDNNLFVWDYISKSKLKIPISDLLETICQAGAGEILINAVHKDGQYNGYDEELINEVCRKVTIPVLACGGAKNAESMIHLLNNTQASAACAGNFFHFFEHSVIITKKQIAQKSDSIRFETKANYSNHELNLNGRLIKQSETVLDNLLYLKLEKEII